ncbi:hypothetical protein K469DRAFT_262476 [Zopfia rhizophila CBS 207.26]|uniref:PD-(D/E)XK nuclease-like domain-containing protein n=1 Tax=Zopfia rhizophila CBS 207.26 TaxID=1314779 RepID=A0A6A6DT47_9PEZI|nr:hypothetical protein K469DRAFT_262476 [Zopfia rhizophila CBS 207.26]
MMTVLISGQQTKRPLGVQHWVEEVNRHSSQHPTPPASQTSSCDSRKRQGLGELTSCSAYSKQKDDMSSSHSGSPRKRTCAAEGDESCLSKAHHHNSSPTCSISPVRDLFNELRLSSPAIHCVPPVIPIGLKSLMQASDPHGTDDIPAFTFDKEDTRTEDQLKALWEEVEDISNEAKECDVYGQDGNAWCLRVIVCCSSTLLSSGALTPSSATTAIIVAPLPHAERFTADAFMSDNAVVSAWPQDVKATLTRSLYSDVLRSNNTSASSHICCDQSTPPMLMFMPIVNMLKPKPKPMN